MELTFESLRNVLFSKEDVIADYEASAVRKYNLNRALILGNLYKHKVVIKFRTIEGITKQIAASVWALGEEYVSLKGGLNIPIRSVEDVEFV